MNGNFIQYAIAPSLSGHTSQRCAILVKEENGAPSVHTDEGEERSSRRDKDDINIPYPQRQQNKPSLDILQGPGDESSKCLCSLVVTEIIRSTCAV